jgi:hypothetical protein
MGGSASSGPHILHHYKPHENKLWIFEPVNERFYCFPVMTDLSPFFFANIESISVPQEKAIFIIGGMYLQKPPEFVFSDIKPTFDALKPSYPDHPNASQTPDPDTPSQDSDDFSNPEESNQDPPSPNPHIGHPDPTFSYFAQAKFDTSGLVPTNLVGYIKYGDLLDPKLIFVGNSEKAQTYSMRNECEQLDLPRSNHSLVNYFFRRVKFFLDIERPLCVCDWGGGGLRAHAEL